MTSKGVCEREKRERERETNIYIFFSLMIILARCPIGQNMNTLSLS